MRGDIGAGKHITLLFELTLNGQKASIDKLRYAPDNKLAKSDKTKELAWLKIRWKYPQGKESQLVEFPLGANNKRAPLKICVFAQQ